MDIQWKFSGWGEANILYIYLSPIGWFNFSKPLGYPPTDKSGRKIVGEGLTQVFLSTYISYVRLHQ